MDYNLVEFRGAEIPKFEADSLQEIEFEIDENLIKILKEFFDKRNY